MGSDCHCSNVLYCESILWFGLLLFSIVSRWLLNEFSLFWIVSNHEERVNDTFILVNIKNYFFFLPCHCDSRYRNKDNTNFWLQDVLLQFTVLGFLIIVLDGRYDYRDVSNSKWVRVCLFLLLVQCWSLLSFIFIACAYNAVLFFPNLAFNKSERRRRTDYCISESSSIQGKSQLPNIKNSLTVVSTGNHWFFCGEGLSLVA